MPPSIILTCVRQLALGSPSSGQVAPEMQPRAAVLQIFLLYFTSSCFILLDSLLLPRCVVCCVVFLCLISTSFYGRIPAWAAGFICIFEIWLNCCKGRARAQLICRPVNVLYVAYTVRTLPPPLSLPLQKGVERSESEIFSVRGQKLKVITHCSCPIRMYAQ